MPVVIRSLRRTPPRLNGWLELLPSKRDKVLRKLDNAEFVAKARPEVVEENRDRLAAFQHDAARIEAAMARIAP